MSILRAALGSNIGSTLFSIQWLLFVDCLQKTFTLVIGLGALIVGLCLFWSLCSLMGSFLFHSFILGLHSFLVAVGCCVVVLLVVVLLLFFFPFKLVIGCFVMKAGARPPSSK